MTQSSLPRFSFFDGESSVGALMRAHDWVTCPLGDPAYWPQPLRTILNLMLNSKFPMFVAWGPELAFLYNDAYSEILGNKHPSALGQRFDQVWSEIWADVQPIVQHALDGHSDYYSNLPLTMHRKGFAESTWFTFSYSPVRDDSGQIAGVYCACTETTEQVLADAKMHELNERLTTTFESITDGFHTMDREWRVTYVNKEAERLLGVQRAALLGKIFWDLYPEEKGGEFHREYERALADRVTVRFDAFLAAHNIWLQVVAYPSDQGLAVYFRDITERRQAERARDESEDRFRLLWQTAPNAIVLTDRNSIIRYANPALQQVFGHPPATLIGNSLALLQPQHLAAGHLRGMRRHLETGQRSMDWRAVETIGKHKDGHEFPIEIAFSSMEIGGELMFAGFMRDITERHQAERALRNSEQSARESAERFRLLSKASRDAIWDWDLQADTLWWNEGYQELFGLQHDPSKMHVQEREAAMHPQDRERVMTGIRQAIAGSATVWSDSYRLLRGDGSQAQVDDRGYLIRDANGLATRMVGALTDVSAKVQLEEQLRQSQRLESIGQLTGGVAHDFNNLLTVVLGNAELLQEALIQDPAHQELASMIGSAAQRGAELTQRLLAFARKQPLDPKPLDVNRLIAGFDPLLRRTLGEHIQIALARGPNLWRALADASQLESALLNLCINSRDAMPDGGTLTIETANKRLDQEYASRYSDLLPGDYVMLAVSDDGYGMEPQVLARVFEPFFTTKETGKGSGLGLSMVYGFVKQSNGHVSVYSEPGHGTTVRLYLPRVSEPADQPVHTSDQPQFVGGRETILLVEDEEMVRAYARGQLAALGYEVIEAPDGKHALDVLRSGAAIDLLFTDVVMPGMGGRQLAEQARLLRPQIKVLFTSGYTENAIVHNGKLDTDVHLLSKPYRRSALANKLREVLDS